MSSTLLSTRLHILGAVTDSLPCPTEKLLSVWSVHAALSCCPARWLLRRRAAVFIHPIPLYGIILDSDDRCPVKCVRQARISNYWTHRANIRFGGILCQDPNAFPSTTSKGCLFLSSIYPSFCGDRFSLNVVGELKASEYSLWGLGFLIGR